MPEDQLELKVKRLQEIIGAQVSVLVAFSGGVDSTYLLHEAAKKLGVGQVLAVTVSSALHPAEEVIEAEKIARKFGVEHLAVPFDLLAIKAVAENEPERCYHCKTALFRELTRLAGERGLEAIFDGTNADDAGMRRPGLRALQELKVSSPLHEAGLSKQEIRTLAKQAGLLNWSKPAAPCLATRFQTGETLTPSRLQAVADAEIYLRAIGIGGNLRVRVCGRTARIEADPVYFKKIDDHREVIVGHLKQLGFTSITVDLEGYRTGSMDQL